MRKPRPFDALAEQSQQMVEHYGTQAGRQDIPGEGCVKLATVSALYAIATAGHRIAAALEKLGTMPEDDE